MNKINLMDIKKQHDEHANEYEEAALRVLRSGNYIGGDEVKLFESEFSSYFNAKHAISVGNGTDALTISLRALGIGVGDEVITIPFTFYATAESIASVGATPKFIDVEKDTYCMNPDLIEDAITEKTKAILPVHFYGHASDMDRINEIAKKHNLFVIEDCAQATGTLYKGKKVGTLGDVGCFSFFPTKVLGCDGDGGMIITDNDDIAMTCRSLKVHGSGKDGYYSLKRLYALKGKELPKNCPFGTTKYYNYLIGYNSRLDSIQAAILRIKLKYLDDFINRRRQNADDYNNAFRGTSYICPTEKDYCKHVYYIYALQHKNADVIMKKLQEKGVPCGTYYPVPLHLQGAFAPLGYKKGDMPVSEKLSNETFAIPVYPELSKEDKDYIIKTILEVEND